jgi:hypothetical protein
MSNTCDARVVYGFNFVNSDMVIDDEWMQEKYPEIQLFALNFAQTYLGDVLYGIPCSFDLITGKASIDEESIERVTELYNIYMNYLKNKVDNEIFLRYKDNVKLGYQLALLDNGEHCKINMNIDPEWKLTK